MSILRSLIAAALLVLAAATPSGAQEPILIRFSHVVAEDTPKGIGARLFKERAEARLPGRVKVEIYPRSQHFTDEEVLMALLFGDVELAAPSFVQFRSFSPAMQIFELPFLFTSTEQVDAFERSEAGRVLMDSMLARGIRGLQWWHNGMRVISAGRTLRVPEDARGLRFRIEPSAIFQQQYQQIGVVGIQMPFARVLDAIREGLVDGQENTWSNIVTRNIQDFQKHYTQLDHSFLGYMVVTSVAFWDRLPADVRQTLEEVLAGVTTDVNRLAAEKDAEDRMRVAHTPGVEIIRPTPAEMEQWRQAFTQVWPQFEPQIGADLVARAITSNQGGR